jgi:splicing factor U2AF subunit
MALDGVEWNGSKLQVRRPKDYNIGASSALIIPGVGDLSDSPFKIVVSGIPPYLSDDQIKDLLEAFGALKSFKLLRDPITGVSKGYAVCEYSNPDLTEIACEGLHGLELGDSKLIMQRANTVQAATLTGPMPIAQPILPIEIIGQAQLKPGKPTSVLFLLNMLRSNELENDEEYEDIVYDVKQECERYGDVLSIMIPRPMEGAEIPGVGKIFIKYENSDCALKAQRALAGRKFLDRTVLATFYDELKFSKSKFD